MWVLLLRGLIAGFVVVGVAEIARIYPRLGALILTMPIVIPAVMVVNYLRDKNLTPISNLSRQTLLLIPLGLPFFVPLAFAEKWGLGFWPALLIGLVLVSLAAGFYLLITPVRS